MKIILYEQRMSSILAALITLALGIVLVVWPDRSVQFLCTLLGLAILLIGLIYILGWLSKRKEGVPSFFVLPGVILGALGIWLMSSPESVVMLIQYIFGAILVVHALIDFQAAITMIRLHREHWRLDLFFALITLGMGVLVLYNPFATFATLVILIGVSFIFDGLSDLCLILRLQSAIRAEARLRELEEVVPSGEDPKP